MSDERLTAEAVLHAQLLGHLQYRLREKVLMAMKQYAAQEAEHKTKRLEEGLEKCQNSNSVLGEGWHRLNEENKQLKEERDIAIDGLKKALYWLDDSEDPWPESAKSVIKQHLDKLNQQHEK